MAIFTNPFKRRSLTDTDASGYLITARGMRAVKGYAGSPGWYFFNDIPIDDVLTPTLQGLGYAYAVSVWVYRCVKARANAIAGIPLVVVDANGDELPNSPLARLLSITNRRLIRDTESDMCIFGHGFWKPFTIDSAYTQDRDLYRGDIWGIRRWNPQTVQIVTGQGGYGIDKYIQWIPGYMQAVAYPDEITHFRDYDPHNDFGSVSPTFAALRDAQVDYNAWEFVKAFFENDATPSLFITTENKLQQPEIERLANQWAKDHQGAKRSHKPKFGHTGMKVEQLQSALKDMIVPELDERTVRRICAAYGVPPTVALASDSANFATAQIEQRSFYTETILPELDMLTDEINRQLVPIICRYQKHKPHVIYNRDDIEALQETPLEKSQRASIGLQSTFRSINEARELEDLPPLEHDFFMVAGQLVNRAELEAGRLPNQPSFANPFALWGNPAIHNPNQQPTLAPSQLRPPSTDTGTNVIDPLERLRDYRSITAPYVISAVLNELKQWQNKALNRGTKSAFKCEFIPRAHAAFIRMDLNAVYGDDTTAQVKAIFQDAESAFKQVDPAYMTPEEFEEYWQGFDDTYDDLQAIFADYLTTLPAHLANAARNGVESIAFADNELVDKLIGTPDAPGPLMASFLAGAARGNDLYNKVASKSIKQSGIGIAWDILSQEAIDYARNYAFGLVQGINETTQKVYQDALVSWLETGGTLTDLADVIEGQLNVVTPPDWSGGKLAWATSPERAYLIAQTETTRAFQEGVKQRWGQLGVTDIRFRTAQDGRVCPTCAALNNQIGTIETGWAVNGVMYNIPVHPNCRCFSAPVL